MSDGEESSDNPPRVNDEGNRVDPATNVCFSPEDALSMCSRQLDNALVRHKKELFAEIDLKIGAGTAEVSNSLPVTTPKFKFDGNGKQHEFNAARLEEIVKVKGFLERGFISAALTFLEKTEKSLKERNKIIRIADKYGWDVVEEFVDPLTENSEEATRLKQAEYRAKAKRREKARLKVNPYFKFPEANETNKDTSELFRRPGRSFAEETSRRRSEVGARNVYSTAEYFRGKKEATRCYYCNGEGHWAYQCPRKAAKYPAEKQQ